MGPVSDDRPLFSVAVPAYNAAETISRAIDSVLSQECDDWELVITDDGSTDDTRAIIDSYAVSDGRITVESQPNRGTGAALNAAVVRSRGVYIVQLGADDMLDPEYTSVMSGFIHCNPGFDIYASNAYRELPDGTRELYHTDPRFTQVFSLTLEDLLEANQIYGSAAFRREVFDHLGGFRPEYHSEDYDFWLRAMMAGATHIYNPRPLAVYRVTQGQKTESAELMRREDIRILRDAIESGLLNAEQVAHAERTIARHERNIAFREGVRSRLSPEAAEKFLGVAKGIVTKLRRRGYSE